MYLILNQKEYQSYKKGLTFKGESRSTIQEAFDVAGQLARKDIKKVHYMRTWTKDNITTIDYGSHTNFLYIVEVPIDDD